MKTIVFDVPAENGGALTVLRQFHASAVLDKYNEWIFVISLPHLDEYKNITVLKYPWVKKSWFHRLYFDRFIAPKLVKEYNVDEVLSLQNLTVPSVHVKQTLYMHQSLPFANKKYKIYESTKLWFYQNIISHLIIKSIHKADKVIVQTQWIMDAVIERTNADKSKFVIDQPDFNISVLNSYEKDHNKNNLFFYPANGFEYKNHEIIIEACRLLKSEGFTDYNIIFTIKGNENKKIKKLYNIVKKEDLPIKFIGTLSTFEVYTYYSQSVLLFASYIETFGLPLLEAKLHNAPIIASNCAFSHEILNDYSYSHFFNPNDRVELKEVLKSFL